ncbi:MAG: MerR family transcriptional regulator [Candidatus Eisenbacteria bacterium]|uniref:MerR family transcriptional regulator n=1 Tax=Eiseniibacteriota bacterium TaxID=2212470 RepID=A0A9D6L7G6_UNCEI|nr:MerR family transcriptional regulator [Candidatus Eisenbacteria bacterium]MBI3540161.1 MerR family transcriptional regulator [Candidatus Eisenbacteria bacterium]
MSSAVETSQLLRVGDLARLTGKTVRAIHLYEELGLLQPATRSSGGFRLYGASAVERVRWIDLLHGAGFSLHEMSELLRSWWSADLGPEAMERLRALFEKKLAETRAALDRFRRLEGELEQGLAYLETCRACATPEAPVKACARCGQDHGMAGEPALVAGITATPERGRRGARGPFVRLEELDKTPTGGIEA